MSKIHLELLDFNRQKIFASLSSLASLGYLAGGTALALQIDHRESEDFDIFLPQPIDNRLRLKIKKQFGEVEFYINSTDQVSFKTKEDVNITYLWYYFAPLRPLVKTTGINLASVLDIAADKAQTIGRRAVWRDYVDLFVLLKEKILTLSKIIALAQKKFEGEFVETQFLEQLAFFEDLRETPINFVHKRYSFAEIKAFLENEVKLYTHKTISFSSSLSHSAS